MASSGDLIKRNYSEFRGVDFTNKEVNLTRSPDALNMWKDYKTMGKCVETRPTLELVEELPDIYGMFNYEIGIRKILVIHSGTKLYKKENGTTVQIYDGMKPARSKSFIYNNILYIKDGINYISYDGQNVDEVEGYIPLMQYGTNAVGKGTFYQNRNYLSDWYYCQFIADGESLTYRLPSVASDAEVWLDCDLLTKESGRKLEKDIDFTISNEADANGVITCVVRFANTPAKLLTDQQDNILVKAKNHIDGNKEIITHCDLMATLNGYLFLSGYEDTPNAVYFSGNDIYGNPLPATYFPDDHYYLEGLDKAKVMDVVSGNNALWVFKEPNDMNNTIYYHVPYQTTDPITNTFTTEFPSIKSNISLGCIGKAVNFNDDIAFFSDRGMEAINGAIESEQVVAHRSSMIDSKLLNEENYKKMNLEEWEGYLLVCIDNKMYLADSREMFVNGMHNEYEWFYWELEKQIKSTMVHDGILYIGTEDGIYTLTGNENILSYWSTPEDEFNAPQYQKITNKRGCVADIKGESISIDVKTDNNDFENIGTYQNVKDYVVSRIKRKKWKSIQIKFSSNERFGLFSCTLESFIGSYLKR